MNTNLVYEFYLNIFQTKLEVLFMFGLSLRKFINTQSL